MKREDFVSVVAAFAAVGLAFAWLIWALPDVEPEHVERCDELRMELFQCRAQVDHCLGVPQ